MNTSTARIVALALAALGASAASAQSTSDTTAGSAPRTKPGGPAVTTSTRPAGSGTTAQADARTAELPPATSDTASGTRGDRSVQNRVADPGRTAVKSQTKASKATGRMQPGGPPTTAGEAPNR